MVSIQPMSLEQMNLDCLLGICTFLDDSQDLLNFSQVSRYVRHNVALKPQVIQHPRMRDLFQSKLDCNVKGSLAGSHIKAFIEKYISRGNPSAPNPIFNQLLKSGPWAFIDSSLRPEGDERADEVQMQSLV